MSKDTIPELVQRKLDAYQRIFGGKAVPETEFPLNGYWFVGSCNSFLGRETYCGQFRGFVDAGERSCFIVLFGVDEDAGHWGLISAEEIWSKRWHLFTPNADGSCPLEWMDLESEG